MTSYKYPLPPRILPDEATHRQVLAETLGRTIQGRQNVVAEIFVSAGASSIELIDPRINPNCFIMFMATNASQTAVTPDIYVSGRTIGKATAKFPSLGGNETFTYLIIG